MKYPTCHSYLLGIPSNFPKNLVCKPRRYKRLAEYSMVQHIPQQHYFHNYSSIHIFQLTLLIHGPHASLSLQVF